MLTKTVYRPDLERPTVRCREWRYTRRCVLAPGLGESEQLLVSTTPISEEEALIPINRWNRAGKGQYLYVLVGPYVEGE